MPEPDDFKLDNVQQTSRDAQIITISKPKTNWLLIVIIVVLVAGALTLYFNKGETLKEQRLKKAKQAFNYIDTRESKLAKLGTLLPPGTGRIVPDDDHYALICSQLTAKVQKILVKPNVLVRKNQLLIVLDNAALKKQRQIAELNLNNARDNLKIIESLKNGPKVNALKARIAAAKTEYDSLEEQIRNAKPFEGITISSANFSELIKRKEIASQNIRSLQAELADIFAQIKLKRINAKHLVKKYETEYSEITDKISQLVIRAPFAGKVYKLFVRSGAYVKAGDKLISVYEPKFVNVKLTMAFANYPQFSIGRKAKIFLESEPHHYYNGKVIALQPLKEQLKNDFAVIVRFQNADDKVLLGCTARVEFAKSK